MYHNTTIILATIDTTAYYSILGAYERRAGSYIYYIGYKYYSILQYTTVYIDSFHQVIDCVMALRNRCCAEEETKHKHDFDWLLEAITKVTI